jgi:hypothetical protein
LQQIAADRDWWSADVGKHYRELTHWLRGVATKCRLPYTQKELLDLARRYDTRADRIDRGPCCPMIGEPPEWASWAMVGLLAFIMLLPTIKH